MKFIDLIILIKIFDNRGVKHMEIRNITAFVRVAETQSFSRAAEQLGYSQSAVTMQIKQLEDALGAQLFERMAGM